MATSGAHWDVRCSDGQGRSEPRRRMPARTDIRPERHEPSRTHDQGRNPWLSVGTEGAVLRGTTDACRRPSRTRSFGSCARCSRSARCWTVSVAKTIGLPPSSRSRTRARSVLSQISYPCWLPTKPWGRTSAGPLPNLVRDVTPVQLSWLDEQVRHSSSAHYWSNAWHKIAPAAISRLAQTYELDASVIGFLASHANGFVRAAALEVLAQHTSGQEIPFLSLRANDWVDPVAARASELLISRLRPDNRHAVLGRAAIHCSRAGTASARP